MPESRAFTQLLLFPHTDVLCVLIYERAKLLLACATLSDSHYCCCCSMVLPRMMAMHRSKGESSTASVHSPETPSHTLQQNGSTRGRWGEEDVSETREWNAFGHTCGQCLLLMLYGTRVSAHRIAHRARRLAWRETRVRASPIAGASPAGAQCPDGPGTRRSSLPSARRRASSPQQLHAVGVPRRLARDLLRCVATRRSRS